MCLNPSLERVKFALEFVRYGASRCVEYTRKDLPWLKELAQRERARQRKLHELATSGERDFKTSPGTLRLVSASLERLPGGKNKSIQS